MADKPTTAAGYRPEHVALVRSTCLYVATKLGDLMDDLVVIGGRARIEELKSHKERRIFITASAIKERFKNLWEILRSVPAKAILALREIFPERVTLFPPGTAPQGEEEPVEHWTASRVLALDEVTGFYSLSIGVPRGMPRIPQVQV